MVNYKGIEVNLAKIRVLIKMKCVGKIKEIQRLIAASTRFVSRFINKCKPFFQALKRREDMKWTKKYEEAFQNIKQYLGNPPMLSKPKEGDDLYVYLVVSKHAVSSILIKEEDMV